MSENIIGLTADIVASFVEKNSISADDLPALIKSIHHTLTNIEAPAAPEAVVLTPAVAIKKSVTPDFIISLEDGRKFKSMKRYLAIKGMTPDQYRMKWNLPNDYPMVAPSYAAARSNLAKTMGLGRKAGEKAPKRKKA
jgi:predicted transcriptional regulator